MVLMIDNYDSFTYNLVQYLKELGADVLVFRNDRITLEKIKRLNPQKIVVSPGPGGPEDAGISCDAIKEFSGRVPILGVCLGHQCVGYAFGAKIVRAKRLMHGKISKILHDRRDIFKGVPSPFSATRYHSLIIDNKGLPSCLKVIASTKDNEIMAVRHRRFPVWGVQFHPESIMTDCGKQILSNFLRL